MIAARISIVRYLMAASNGTIEATAQHISVVAEDPMPSEQIVQHFYC